MKDNKNKVVNLDLINKYLRKVYLMVGVINVTWLGLLALKIPLGITLGLPRHLYLGVWMKIGIVLMLLTAVLTVIVIIEAKRKSSRLKN